MAAQNVQFPDDAVEYRLFPYIPEDCTPQEIEKYLQEQIEICVALLSSYLVEYIWQNEPFQLRPVPVEKDGVPPHIYGATNFGDNIEDEWFTVFLLRHLTEEFPGLVVQVQDNDGEFLLIEAANTLPKWVTPDTAENRIYLYEGVLHVIPYPLTPAHVDLLPTSTPSATEAVNCIRSNPGLTMAQSSVQEDIQNRLQGYPEKAGSSRDHHAHCYLPAPLAAVVEHNPSLVAPMVQAFYYRDPIDLKACITFQKFPPGTRVMRRVRFTRCLYAQLLQQRFTPDKRSGYTMPANSNPKFQAYDLGMKLAHGAEILCSKCGSVDTTEDPLKHITTDPRWNRYKATLDAKGYFKAELEGSKLYNKLLEDAKRYFVKSLGSKESGTSESSPGAEVLRLSKQIDYDIEEMRKQERTLLPPDDDKWIEIDPADLDAMLEKASGKRPVPSHNNDLKNMSQGVSSFVNNVSSHEGVEVPKDDDNEIQFDPNSFMQSMQKVFDFEDSDGNSSSDLSEYGSDDDFDDYLPSNKTKSPKKSSGHKDCRENGDKPAGDILGIKDYMDIMDRELANTSIGASFEKYPAKEKESSPPKAPPRKKKQARKAAAQNVNDASGSTSSSSQSTPHHRPNKPPHHRPNAAPHARMDDEDMYDVDDIDEDFQPVNVDLNMVKNLMESYSAQGGGAGPTSNMLGSMGVRVPHDGRSDDF